MTKEQKQKIKEEKKNKQLEKKNAKWTEKYGISFSEVSEKVKTKKSRGFPKFKKFLFRYKKHIKSYVLFLIFGIILASFAILFPIFTENAISNLTEQNWEKAIMFFALFAGVTILNQALNSAYSVYGNKISNNLSHSSRMDVISSLSKTQVKKFDTTASGEVMMRSLNDANAISDSVGFIISYFTQALGFLMYIFYSLYLNIWLGLILLTSGILSFIVNNIYLKRFQKYYIRRNIMISEKMYSERAEMVRGIRDVKFLGISETILSSFKTTSLHRNNAFYDNTKARNWLNMIQTTRNMLFLLAFAILGVIFVKNSWVPLSAFIVLIMYRGNFYQFFTNVNSLITEMQTVEIHSERLMQIFDENEYPKEKFGNIEIKNLKGKIEFKNVTFAYEDTRPVLNDVSFTIQPNECVGFVGKSGEGKSTIVSLIPKLYDTNKGSIYLDDKKIKNLTENTIRNSISVVSQMPYIFNKSIKENLLLAKKDATMEELETACKQAQLYNFIQTLPDKYDTKVGEGGIKLSGGQRQRLAIARTLLQNSKIIVFDEATSALDNESQGKIQIAIDLMKKNRTVIIIAHRLTTIKDCDKIFVLDNHKIIAEGTHKELMRSCSIYKNLYKSEEK